MMMMKTCGTSRDQHREPQQRARLLESRALRFVIPAPSDLANRTWGAGLSVPAEEESDSSIKAIEKRYLEGSDATSPPKRREKETTTVAYDDNGGNGADRPHTHTRGRGAKAPLRRVPFIDAGNLCIFLTGE